jgi:hypothetical protein
MVAQTTNQIFDGEMRMINSDKIGMVGERRWFLQPTRDPTDRPCRDREEKSRKKNTSNGLRVGDGTTD